MLELLGNSVIGWVAGKAGGHPQTRKMLKLNCFIVRLPKLGGGFKCLLFSPRTLGKTSNLTNVFQVGWFNHQPAFRQLGILELKLEKPPKFE